MTGIADFDAASEQLAARGCALGQPLRVLAATASTNDDAKRAAKEGAPHGATWVADVQSAGRGRQGRAWLAAPGEALLASVLLRVSCPPARVPLLALGAGLATRDAVAHFAPGVDVRVKWPNDVLVGGRKIAGILVESSSVASAVAAVVVGVGLNVHTREFPAAIAEHATSLARVLAPAPCPSRAIVLAELLGRIDAILPRIAGSGLAPFHARIQAADALFGREVHGDAGAGRAVGIDVDGRLMVQTSSGALARWTAGEVHLQAVSHEGGD